MAKLRYPKEYYSIGATYGYAPLTREQREHEYDKMRKQAAKALERIGRSEFAEDRFYQQYYGRWTKPAAELSERELAFELRDLAYFRASEKGTYTGARRARREAVKAMKAAGYDWVTYKNYGAFSQFMGMVKTAYGEHLYDSKRIVEYYEENKKGNVSSEELFADFVQFQTGRK